MSANQESRIQPGKVRKRVVILALFAIAIAFYVASFFVVSG